jgi:hypothetical protein
VSEPAQKQGIQKLILSAFQNFSPSAKESTLAAIEERCQVKVADLDASNYERFLDAMEQQLATINEPWKATFVTRVVRTLLQKKLNL